MTIESLFETLADTMPAERLRLIERAYTVAAYWHRAQKRKSGDPYIVHPVAVAGILAEAGMDHEVLCAALLHDVLEDTDCPAALLIHEFGDRITDLVIASATVDDPVALASCTDERVLALKSADRLHNLRTIRFLPPSRQRRKSRHTLEVLAPLAVRLGLEEIGAELATLARAVLSPPVEAGHRSSNRTLALGVLLLPEAHRSRWLQEWFGELQAIPRRSARVRFTVELLMGMPRMAVTLRGAATDLRDLPPGRMPRDPQDHRD